MGDGEKAALDCAMLHGAAILRQEDVDEVCLPQAFAGGMFMGNCSENLLILLVFSLGEVNFSSIWRAPPKLEITNPATAARLRSTNIAAKAGLTGKALPTR